jgi:hypothetical protein
MMSTNIEQMKMDICTTSCDEGSKKYSREWRKEHGIIFGVSYLHGRPDIGMTLEIYDKSGNVRSRLKLDEKMMQDLKQDIDICLGLIKEEEE